MATATKPKLHKYHVVLQSKSKTARASIVVIVVKAESYTDAVELAKGTLKSPTRWTT